MTKSINRQGKADRGQNLAVYQTACLIIGSLIGVALAIQARAARRETYRRQFIDGWLHGCRARISSGSSD